MADNAEETLLDYDSDEAEATEQAQTATTDADKDAKGSYVSMHSSGFKDFMLKPELLRAIVDCGFEHPSAVQTECIPRAIIKSDIICQAKAGMGKTAVFVLATLQQLEPVDGEVGVIVMCHTRELAFQIKKEYERFSKYMPNLKTEVFFGGVPISQNETILSENCPHVLVCTPGRTKALVLKKKLDLSNVKHFVLDECDRMLEEIDMRADVQIIFKATPCDKQTMMFSATLSKEIRPICKLFMQDPMEVYVDDEAGLRLDGLKQHYIKLTDAEKNRKLFDLLDVIEFNQVVIFVSATARCKALTKLLTDQNFPAISIHGALKQPERLERYQQFKNFEKRILVATDLFGRGMDIEKVNVVFNYDMPASADQYLHRVARAGRFGTKGMAISFVTTDEDAEILNQVQSRLEVQIDEMPDEVDASTYTEAD